MSFYNISIKSLFSKAISQGKTKVLIVVLILLKNYNTNNEQDLSFRKVWLKL